MNEEIEQSLIKKFRKTIWSRFIKSLKEFDLVKDGDKIAVCISGGKDSFLLAKCMQELKRHGQVNFELVFLCMDPGYTKKNLDSIIKNSKTAQIDLHIFKTDIFEYISTSQAPCYICARMRRGYLYFEAQKLGCNKIALGHHFNDVIETVLLSIIYNGEFKTMLPILDSKNYKDMKLIRPLYYVKEESILKFVKYNKLEFIDCACRVVNNKQKIGKRKDIKKVVEDLVSLYENADINILNSTKSVNLKTIISHIDKDIMQ